MAICEARGVFFVLGDKILLDGSCHCVLVLISAEG